MFHKEENTRADMLSWLADTKSLGINHSFVKETNKELRIEYVGIKMAIMDVGTPLSWMTPIRDYIGT